MKLAQLAVLNWGQIESRDYPLAEMTLLTGETGAGKSTLLDALQAVMTAARSGLYAFNPGQEATSQTRRDGKSKRSLAAYVVGADGKGNFLRAGGAHGYLAAAFVRDTGDPLSPFTAVLALAARVEGQGQLRQAKEEALKFFIVEGQTLGCRDLALKDDLSEVVAVDKAYNHLRLRYGSGVSRYDDKGSYLQRLYGLFLGRSNTATQIEVHAAAKAFSRSIAYREIGSVDELVKTEMLSERDMGEQIAQIMSIIRSVDELKREAERLGQNIARLETLQEREQVLRGSLLEQVALLVLDAAKRHQAALAACERQREANEKAAARLGVLDTAKQGLEREAAALQTRRTLLIQKQTQSAAWQAVSTLEEGRKRAQQAYQTALTPLLATVATLEQWQQRIRQWTAVVPSLPSALQEPFLPLLRAATSVAAASTDTLRTEAQVLGGSLTPDAERLNRWLLTLAGFDKKLAAIQQLLQPEQGETLQTQVLTAALEADRQKADLEAQATALRDEAKEAERGFDYPPNVRAALPQLRLKFPDAEAVVLADLVEPKPGSTWMNAIEGLMGQERYVLLVRPVWEAPVIDWLKERMGRAAPTVAQAGKALRDSERRSLPARSVIDELEISHPLALAFVTARFGSTVKVLDTVTLTQTAQGLMQNGLSARSYQIRNVVLTDDQLIFGLTARKARAEVRKQKIERLDQQIELQKAAAQGYRVLAKLLLPQPLPAIAEAAEAARQATTAWSEAERQLGLLDRSDLKELEEEEADINRAATQNKKDLEGNAEDSGACKTEKRNAEEALREQEQSLPLLAQLSSARQTGYRDYCKPDPGLDAEASLVQLLAESSNTTVQSLTARREQARERAGEALAEVKNNLIAYNREAKPHEQVQSSAMQWPVSGSEPSALFHAGLLELAANFREQLRRQKLIGLAEKQKELDDANKNFNSAFSAHFCYRIKNDVDEGVETLKRLNRELKKLRFGSDIFECDWQWLPQGKERYDYFEHLHQQSDAGGAQDLFAAPLPEALARVRDELKNLLLTGDPEKARLELKRIADYREYRRYEVYAVDEREQKVALSIWGSGSGGELETPAYVVRAAICAEAFKLFHGSGPRLRLMMFDEAFSKIDAKRSRDLLIFLHQHLGMQILCAMPTRGAGALLPAFQRQYSFAAVKHVVDGREQPQSLVQRKDFRPSVLAELWEARRQEVRESARRQFEVTEAAQLPLPGAGTP